MDAAGKFIRAALDGDYKKARTYLVNDSTNNQMIEIYEETTIIDFPLKIKRHIKQQVFVS